MSDNIKTMNAPGIPCPDCQTPIVVEALKLLSGADISCAACGLELQVDRQKSASTISVLSDYMQTLNEIKSSPTEALSGTGAKSSRQPKRRTRQPRQSRRRSARA